MYTLEVLCFNTGLNNCTIDHMPLSTVFYSLYEGNTCIFVFFIKCDVVMELSFTTHFLPNNYINYFNYIDMSRNVCTGCMCITFQLIIIILLISPGTWYGGGSLCRDAPRSSIPSAPSVPSHVAPPRTPAHGIVGLQRRQLQVNLQR